MYSTTWLVITPYNNSFYQFNQKMWIINLRQDAWLNMQPSTCFIIISLSWYAGDHFFIVSDKISAVSINVFGTILSEFNCVDPFELVLSSDSSWKEFSVVDLWNRWEMESWKLHRMHQTIGDKSMKTIIMSQLSNWAPRLCKRQN